MKTKNKYFKINRELNFNNILSLEDEIYVMTKEMVVSILQLNAE